jgi:hypothetical protein
MSPTSKTPGRSKPPDEPSDPARDRSHLRLVLCKKEEHNA